jgi:SAM-dependent methyltransferase
MLTKLQLTPGLNTYLRKCGDYVMTDEILVWHYGLMAERWADTPDETPELPFFLKQIERFGQPVLDLACGTGRVLLPLLRAGIDIDGCDFSEDMLFHCRRKATADGFNPNLYAQPMHAFDLPRRYKTIYICDSFGLSGSRENDLATLRRCHAHLRDNGALLVNIEAEYVSAEDWVSWAGEYRRSLPEPWPEEGSRRVASDGSEHVSRFRMVQIDPLEQTYMRQVRLEKWETGRLVVSEEYALRGNMYLKPELLLMLKVAGFREIAVHGDYTDDPATADSNELVFVALK